MAVETGWRVWGVRREGGLTRAFWHTVQQVWDDGWVQASCSRRHPAPAADCWCGIHVITSEGEMWAFVADRFVPGRSAPCVVGAVEFEGAAMKSLIPNDPPSTLRVERARVAGPIVLLPGAEPFAAAIGERYGVRVVGQQLHELHRALGMSGMSRPAASPSDPLSTQPLGALP